MQHKILIVLTSQEKFEDKNGVTLEDKPTGWFLVRRFITKSPCIESNFECSLNLPTPIMC